MKYISHFYLVPSDPDVPHFVLLLLMANQDFDLHAYGYRYGTARYTGVIIT